MFTVINNLIKALFKEGNHTKRVVYLDVYETIKKAVESGMIPQGTQLPPTRILADQLNLSRSTIVKAYNLLTENKLLNTRQGSGFFVAETNKIKASLPEETAGYPTISEVGESFLHNIHILNNTAVEGVAFTPGLPPLDIFPIGQWQKLSNLYWRNIKTSDLNYSISSGINSLKENIANYLLLTRKIKCDPAQIMIVSGSLQSLYLVGNVLIDKGDVVYMENPTFPNVISIFKSLRAQVVPVSIDSEGLRIDKMTDIPGKSPKLVHVTPSNQYPMGGKMSRERRLQLLNWANQHNAMIIENDYEHEINNWHDPVESVFSLDRQQRTIYLGTFNRTLHPSIRLGYMILPPYLLPAVKALQMHSHRFVPQSIQAVMTDFIRQNLIYKHLRKVIEEAADRKELFLSLFEKYFEDNPISGESGITIRNVDNSSFHLVAELADEVDDEKLVSALERKGIITHALSKCYIEAEKKRGLILGYSCINRGFMAQFVARMAGVYLGKG